MIRYYSCREPRPAGRAPTVYPAQAGGAALRRASLRQLPAAFRGGGGSAPGRGGHRHRQRRRVRQIHQLVAVRAGAPVRLRAPAGPAGRARLRPRRRPGAFRRVLPRARRGRRTAGGGGRGRGNRGVRGAHRLHRARRPSSATSTTSRRRSSSAGANEGFLPVASPTSVVPDRVNEYYKSDRELLYAIADAMRVEYRAIIDAGLSLQLDDARLAVTYDRMVPPASFADYRNWVAMNVEAINHSLGGIPEERVRYHVCWGSWPGPHVTDVPLKDIVDLMLKVKAGTYLIEGANPRHEHEWRVWESVKLPAGKRARARRDQPRHQRRRAPRARRRAPGAPREARRPRAACSRAPIAASRRGPSTAGCIPRSCGRSSRRSSKAPASPAASFSVK